MSKTKEESKIIKPVCPFCSSEMIVTRYIGYYDTFRYWDCPKCNDEKLTDLEEDSWSGEYA